VDGTNNRSGTIRKYARLKVNYQNKEKILWFFVTDLGRDRIIFGLPWFKHFDPKINWKKGTLESPMMAKTMNALLTEANP
jgi:hypothetical protein